MKKFKMNALIIGIITVSFASAAWSASATVDEIVEKLQKNYSAMKDYRAFFIQEAKIKGYPKKQESSGEVYFKKGGKMRWNYDKPEKQEIVTDGTTLWMYTPSLNQVMQAGFSMTNQSRVAQAFLSGMGSIRDDFNISGGELDETGMNYMVMLTPKDATEKIRSLELTVDSKTFYIKRSRMTDIYDNVTIVSLSDFRINSGLTDSLFDFIVPQGVEVVTPQTMQ